VYSQKIVRVVGRLALGGGGGRRRRSYAVLLFFPPSLIAYWFLSSLKMVSCKSQQGFVQVDS